MPDDAPRIQPLPPTLIDQIAAGEVVERPASVAKELIDNALDAGATRVDVTIERGGRDLIRVLDDGAGIRPDDLVAALHPHATSKIASLADLESVATMGFRGEALASIGSVSRLFLRSRRRGSDASWSLRCDGGERSEPRPDAGPTGTLVEMRSLFHNTPARRKFLRTDRTEQARVAEVVRLAALAHPGITFTLTADRREVLAFEGHGDARRRVLDVIGRELEPELLEADGVEAGVTVWGLIGTPQIARGSGRGQRVFLNGRPIEDASVRHALREGYRGLIEPGRHPTAALFLSLDPSAVDVNVHPAKTEVRFRDAQAVHAAVRRVVRRTLAAASIVPEVALDRLESPTRGGAPGAGGPDFGPGRFDARSASGETRRRAGFGGHATQRPGSTGDAIAGGRAGFDRERVVEMLTRPESAVLPDGSHAAAGAGDPALVQGGARRVDALRAHAKYLVVEDPDGIVIVDQHALHERVMFEELLARVQRAPLESQRLLVPDVVDVDDASIEAFERLGPLLERLGFEAGTIGPRSLAIHAAPSFLASRHVEAGAFLAESLRFVVERGGGAAVEADEEALLADVLDMMACKAAVKAGDRLSESEIARLLALREEVERSSNCPHGRPTSIRIGLRDLDRRFGRG